MKIFYAVQATGNGHISRAMTLMPHLQKWGTVDVFLSGNNSHLRAKLSQNCLSAKPASAFKRDQRTAGQEIRSGDQ
ncbi:MAG: hypothetical protein EBT80_08470 [Chitinophagales bacterium]|nr:hypothetical protein [Chitinophagales bacterium]